MVVLRAWLAVFLTVWSLGVWAGPPPANTQAHLRIGPVYPVAEPDLIEEMQAKVQALKDSGKLAQLQSEAVARSKKSIEEPKSLNLPRTGIERKWLVDTSYTVPQDLADHNGKVFARAGERVNAFERGVKMRRPLLFIDGADRLQTQVLNKLLVTYPTAMVVLTGGRWRSVAEQLGGLPADGVQKVYFDQGGNLVRSLGIQAVPAVAFQNHNLLEVHEIVP
jgi:conjugal transfer pilus assembly protein TraW